MIGNAKGEKRIKTALGEAGGRLIVMAMEGKCHHQVNSKMITGEDEQP